mmetsp:Transcript_22808/g.54230  ORF Transcript_22808/g.54230 Transcript_22808/m.54230 type:complete len:206 (-) Transcript_22808:22-639(-)
MPAGDGDVGSVAGLFEAVDGLYRGKGAIAAVDRAAGDVLRRIVGDAVGDAVDGHRVHAVDADGRAVLGQLVDENVPADLRAGWVLAVVAAGALTAGGGLVMDAHRGEGIVRGPEPVVVRVRAGFVHGGQGQVARRAAEDVDVLAALNSGVSVRRAVRLVPRSVHGVRAAAVVVFSRHQGREEGGEHGPAHLPRRRRSGGLGWLGV